MPVKIGSFEPLSEEECTVVQLRTWCPPRQDRDRPVGVPLVDDQSPHGLGDTMSRAAVTRGLSAETLAKGGLCHREEG